MRDTMPKRRSAKHWRDGVRVGARAEREVGGRGRPGGMGPHDDISENRRIVQNHGGGC